MTKYLFSHVRQIANITFQNFRAVIPVLPPRPAPPQFKSANSNGVIFLSHSHRVAIISCNYLDELTARNPQQSIAWAPSLPASFLVAFHCSAVLCSAQYLVYDAMNAVVEVKWKRTWHLEQFRLMSSSSSCDYCLTDVFIVTHPRIGENSLLFEMRWIGTIWCNCGMHRFTGEAIRVDLCIRNVTVCNWLLLIVFANNSPSLYLYARWVMCKWKYHA